MKKQAESKEGDGLRVRRSPEFKLKDKAGRNFQVLKLIDFGFIPNVLIIEKVHGKSNTMVISAVLTDEEAKKEDKLLAKLKVQQEKEDGRSKPVTNKPTSRKRSGSGATTS